MISEDRLELIINSTNPTNPNKIEILKSTVETKKGDPNMWTLFFDGSKYLEGPGVGCIPKDMKGRKNLIACILELPCTNNIVEYEALLQGLRKAIDLKDEKIKVFGDSEIFIILVRNIIHFLSIHLKHYQLEVWELINRFVSFNISSIPCPLNCDVDLLANVASTLIPSNRLMPNTFSIEILYRPLVLDNVTSWRVFDDDLQLINVLHLKDTFKESIIYDIVGKPPYELH